MSSFRLRDDDSISTGTVIGVLLGAVAGFAAGMFVAQRYGGLDALRERVRRRGAARSGRARHESDEDLEDYESDELEDAGDEELLEERVLEAFRNDPILAERAVDIGGVGEGTIELSGWVEDEHEADHAVTLARGVPGVHNVLSRLAVSADEERFADAARRAREGDPALTEAHWDTNMVGTGRRRQGTSREPDRHADPRLELEERWLDEREAIRNAAEPMEGLAERRRGRPPRRGDRTGGSPIAPSGVPKADHVVNPEVVKDEGGVE